MKRKEVIKLRYLCIYHQKERSYEVGICIYHVFNKRKEVIKLR